MDQSILHQNVIRLYKVQNAAGPHLLRNSIFHNDPLVDVTVVVPTQLYIVF